MKNKVLGIALEFVDRGMKQSLPITQMKLQKMLYFAQGIHLVTNNLEPMFDDKFQAWQYGPVIPIIYHEYKLYGNRPIMDTDWVSSVSKKSHEIENSTMKSIDVAWNVTKEISAVKLSNWTHAQDSPWKKYYIPGVNDIIIPNEDIAQYFSRFLKKKNS